MYMPHEAILKANFINPFQEQYALSNCCGNNRKVSPIPEPNALELDTYMPPELISTAKLKKLNSVA
jgi:hypothetical protein